MHFKNNSVVGEDGNQDIKFVRVPRLSKVGTMVFKISVAFVLLTEFTDRGIQLEMDVKC